MIRGIILDSFETEVHLSFYLKKKKPIKDFLLNS